MRPTPSEKFIDALPEDVRDRVRERAAILWESGKSDEEANQLAYEMESGRPLALTLPGKGVARAQPRVPTKKRRTGSAE